LAPESATDDLKSQQATDGSPAAQESTGVDAFEALYRFVLDVFKGYIIVWSGRTSATLAVSGESTPYKLSVDLNSRPTDLGTTICVRLPISR